MDKKLEPYFPSAFRWFGGILIIISLLSLIQGSWMWPPLTLVLGVLLLIARNAVELDFSGQRFRQYASFLGLKFGAWQDLPILEKIIITESHYSQVISSRVSSTSHHSRRYRTVLREGKDFKLVIESSKEYQSALTTARWAAKVINMPILDCTKRPPIWIE